MIRLLQIAHLSVVDCGLQTKCTSIYTLREANKNPQPVQAVQMLTTYRTSITVTSKDHYIAQYGQNVCELVSYMKGLKFHRITTIPGHKTQ
jgi:hypothetical protein